MKMKPALSSRFNQGAFLRVLFIAIPFMVLIVDFITFPIVLESWTERNDASVASLLTHRVISLGTYRAHQIKVSTDAVLSDKYLSYVIESPNALLISHFVDIESQEMSTGVLARAVLGKLRMVSPEDAQKLQDFLGEVGKRRPGETAQLSLNIPKDQYRRFPIDRLFLLLFDQGQPGKSIDALSRGMRDILKRAEDEGISTLVIPPLAYNPQSRGTLEFDDLFEALFASMPVTPTPRTILVSLYSEWPTFTLEEAFASLSRAWEKSFGASYGKVPVLFRGIFRVTLALLSVCLLVSSFYARLTAKNSLIITSVYIGWAVGSDRAIDFVSQGHGTAFHTLVQIALLVTLAVGLPFFVRWNPKSIFGSSGG